MEFQRAWELTGFDDANAADADDSDPIGPDVDPGAAGDAEEVNGPDAAAGFDDTAEMSEVVVDDVSPDPGTGAAAGAVLGVAAASAGARRPGALVAVRKALRGRTNAALAASGLVVCLVAILVATAWHSSDSGTSAGAGAGRAPQPPTGTITTDASGPSHATSSGAPDQRRSASASGSATGAATSSGATAPGQSNAAPAPQGQPTALRAPQAQQISTVHITGLAGKCLGAAGGGSGNGTSVDLYPCNGGATQQWGMFSDGTIRTAGKCMEAAGGSTSDGTRVQLYDCNGTAAQQWTHTAGNDLVNPRANKCLDLKERSSADFTVTQIWSCNGGSNQKWTLS